MKVSIRKKKAAAFELLCDTMAHRECSGCGLIYDGGESPFWVADHDGAREYTIFEMRFCPRCGAPLRLPEDQAEAQDGR